MLSVQKKVGLALGGGSARGFAHIGVLKVLEKENIPIDILVGSSMGAVIGAIYCSGVSLSMLERLACYSQRSLWMDWTFPRMGLAAGDKMEQLVLLLTKKMTFEQMNRTFAVVATDLCSAEKVILNKGNVARAVRASTAIPGIFRPIEDGERTLVDGSVIERVPAPTARFLGADFVIAVDVGIYVVNQKPQHILDVITQSLDVMQRDLCRFTLDEADVVIRPQLQDISPGHFHKAEEAIRAGEVAALNSLPQIRELLRREVYNETIT